MVLENRPVRLSIPASDLARARQFYADKLGLVPSSEGQFGLNYQAQGTFFTIVPSDSAGVANYSLMTWVVDDLHATVNALRARGILLEEYDLPFMKTVNGIADFGQDQVAWFKDSEGNLLAIAQLG